ncbi:hypothetical protein AB1Y20_015798 [Prymnesium parvum]|uniref:Uncharacterized protein n=1 Tax=Prymnesium parvum TaxID=97485 RepID=A0AB34K2I3_PRYPA
MAMRSNGLAGMKLEHTVLQREELSGLAALFASNWDGIPQSSRLEAASRVAALRQERLSLESAARRRAELASYESQARVMGMERRLVELRASAARRASGTGVGLEPPVAAQGDVDTRAQLEAARARFAEYVEEVAPRVTGERVDASAQLVEQLRRKRQEVEARRHLAQAEFARQLELEREAEEERERLRQALQVEAEDKAKLREVLTRPRPSRQYYEPLQPQDVEVGWEEEESAARAHQAHAPRAPATASAAPAVKAGGGGAAGPVATSRVVPADVDQDDEARDAATDMESKVTTVATSGAMPDRSMVHSERSGSPRQPAACQLSSEGTAITAREANAPPNRMHLDAFDVKTSVHIEQTGGACHVYLSGSRCDSTSSRIDAPAEAAHTSERWTMTDSAREEQPREEQPREAAVGKGGGEPAGAEPSRETQQLAMLQVQVQLQQLAVLQSLQQHHFFRSSPTPPPWHGGGPGERQAEAEARQLEEEWARLEEERERLAARRGLRPSWPPYGGARIDHEVRRSAGSLAAERSRLEAERAQLATADANAEARRTHDGLTPSAQRPRGGAAPFVREPAHVGSGAQPVHAASLDATLGDAWRPLGDEGGGDAPLIRAEEQRGCDEGAAASSQGSRGASGHSAAGAEWEAPVGPRVVEHGTLSDWEEDEFSSERDDAVGWEEKARQAARQKAKAEAEEDQRRRAEEARAAEVASRKAEMEAARKREQEEQEAAEREDYEARLAAAREEERRIEQAQLEAERELARMAEEERKAAEAEEKARRELEEAEAAQREAARVAAEREAAERARQAAEEEARRQAEERAAKKAAEVARQKPPSELEIAPLARALQKRCELSSRGDAKAIVQAWRSLSAEVPKQLDSRAAASWRQDAAMGLYALSVGECAGALRALVISRGVELVPPEVLAKHDPPELHHLREHLSPTDWSLLVILLCHLHFSAKAANLSRSEECTLLLPSLLHGSSSSGGATAVAQFLDSILPPVGAPAPDWMLTGELEGFSANEQENVPDTTGNVSGLISPIDSLPSSPGFGSEEKHGDFSSDLHVAESGERKHDPAHARRARVHASRYTVGHIAALIFLEVLPHGCEEAVHVFALACQHERYSSGFNTSGSSTSRSNTSGSGARSSDNIRTSGSSTS